MSENLAQTFPRLMEFWSSCSTYDKTDAIAQSVWYLFVMRSIEALVSKLSINQRLRYSLQRKWKPVVTESKKLGFVFWTDPSEKNAEDAGGVDELSNTSSSARRRALPVQPTGKSTRGGFPTHRTGYESQVPLNFMIVSPLPHVWGQKS